MTVKSRLTIEDLETRKKVKMITVTRNMVKPHQVVEQPDFEKKAQVRGVLLIFLSMSPGNVEHKTVAIPHSIHAASHL